MRMRYLHHTRIRLCCHRSRYSIPTMKLSSALASGAILTVFTASASAHTARESTAWEKFNDQISHPSRRHGRLASRAAPSNAAQMAKVSSTAQACKPYGVPASSELSKMYPKSGQIATILSNDKEAQAVWSEIQKSGIIPQNVKVKNGVEDHMGISQKASDSYDNSKDPDCWWTATQCHQPKAQNVPTDIYTCDEPNTWGLTFDDGPNCSHNAFYDYLRNHKLKATLFYIGTNVIDLPLHAQRGLSDGHDVCVHTWSHHYMTTLSDEQVFAELYYTMRIIKDVVGVTTRCWRPPFGDVDDRVRAIAAGLGLRTIIWADDTDDWNVQPGGSEPRSKIESNYQKIIKKGYDSGSTIVLTHEIRGDTMQLFQDMYPQIRKAFKNVIPLTACLNVTTPYAEDNITYSVFSDFVKGNINAKGLPSADNMPINPGSKLNLQTLDQQTQGSFSPKAMSNTKNSSSGSSSSSTGSSSSSAGSSSQSSDSSSTSGNGQAQSTSGSSGNNAAQVSTNPSSDNQDTSKRSQNSAVSTQINIYVLTAIAALSITVLV